MENNNLQLASRLLNDSNNLVLWHCYLKRNENIFFSYGITAEWFTKKELSDHGQGVYAFFKPDGAQKKCEAQKGYAVMKGVLLGKFNNFLIFDSELAKQYYGNSDIRTQAEVLFTENDFKNQFLSYFYQICGSYELTNICDISKALYNKFKTKLRIGKVRGIVYNNEQAPHACIIFNPREFVPISVTTERILNTSGKDFDSWEIKVNDKMLAYIAKFPDYYSYGERLKAEGLIKDYSAFPPQYGFIRIKLKNGRLSFYDVNANKIISQYGFNQTIGFSKDKDGTIECACSNNNHTFYIVPHDGEYYVCMLNKDKNEYIPHPQISTLDEYDKYMIKHES